MRVEVDPLRQIVTVVLSQANILALLTKLSMGDSACTIFRDTEENWRVIARSESDEQHYVDRERGEMHPYTEAMIKARRSVLEG